MFGKSRLDGNSKQSSPCPPLGMEPYDQSRSKRGRAKDKKPKELEFMRKKST